MSVDKRWTLYPNIGYYSTLKHCAYSFHLMSSFVDMTEGFVPDPDGKHSSEEGERYHKVTTQNLQKFKEKFPIDELVKKPEFAEKIKKFTGIDDDIFMMQRDDPIGVLIACNSPIFAPQLNIQIEYGYIQVGLHNGGYAAIGISMAAYGLNALRIIYDAYEVSSKDLPVLDFQDKELKVTVPIVHIDEERNYDLQVENVIPQVLESSLEFAIPYSMKCVRRKTDRELSEANKRSVLAFALLEKTTKAAAKNIFILGTPEAFETYKQKKNNLAE